MICKIIIYAGIKKTYIEVQQAFLIEIFTIKQMGHWTKKEHSITQ
jgi:hypothetical protein